MEYVTNMRNAYKEYTIARTHNIKRYMYILIVYACFLMISGGIAYEGCTLTGPQICNPDTNATINDGSCVQCSAGQICDGETACCFDGDSNGICDYDEICNYPTDHGCTNVSACNYDPSASIDIGNCILCGAGNTCASATSCCDDPDNNNICGDQGGSSGTPASPTRISGCMVPTACNFNENATSNDGSCVFPGCDGLWCPGDGPMPLMDDCGVCDANMANDNMCDIEVNEDETEDEDETEVGDETETEVNIDEEITEENEEEIEDEDEVEDETETEDDDEDETEVEVVDETETETEDEDESEVVDETETEVEIDEEIIEENEEEIEEEIIEEEIVDFPIVEGSVYVEFDNPVEQKAFEDLIKKYGIDSIDQPFTNLDITTYRIDFDPNIPYGEFVQALKDTFAENITFTEPIPLIQVNLPLSPVGDISEQVLPDYLSQIGYDTLLNECGYLFTSQQKKIRVAIVDNGYAYHDDLWDNVVYMYDAADKDKDVTISETSEACAHGNIDAGLVGAISTNNIGIISAGYNPELVLIKATPDGRPCTDITAGIEGLAKAADHADIINISWGVDFDSQVLKNVVDKIIKKGVIIVAAAGNFDTNKAFYPAAYEGVISVGAVTNDNKKARFSNHGARVDISAPGVDMLSTAMENGYAKVSGTSQASPLTAGRLAFLMSHNLGVDELYTYLTPIDREDMGRGIIHPGGFCASMCSIDYTGLDYTKDGEVDSDDVLLLTDRINKEYIDFGCDESFTARTCCPAGTICDIDASGGVDAYDISLLENIVGESVYYEVCGDGIDNNCDGVVDCEEHGVAPLLATTASSGNARSMYGVLLIVLVLIIGGGVGIWKKAWFINE